MKKYVILNKFDYPDELVKEKAQIVVAGKEVFAGDTVELNDADYDTQSLLATNYIAVAKLEDAQEKVEKKKK